MDTSTPMNQHHVTIQIDADPHLAKLLLEA